MRFSFQICRFKVLINHICDQKPLNSTKSSSLLMPLELSELRTMLNINTHIISSEQRKIKVFLPFFRPGFSSQMSTMATQLEHIINRVKHNITCNLKPPFWINYSLCKYVPPMTQRLAHIQNKNNPVLCSHGCGPGRVFTSLPMPKSPSTTTITSLSLAVNVGLFASSFQQSAVSFYNTK